MNYRAINCPSVNDPSVNSPSVSSPSTNYHVIRGPEEVREVLRRVDDFEPTNALTSVVPLSAATLRTLTRARFALPPVLASATGDLHRKVRRVVAGFFTPAKVQAIGPRISELASVRAQAASHTLESGSTDLVEAVSQHVPPAIVQDLTGISMPDLTSLKRWSQDSLELFWGTPSDQRQLALAESAAEFYSWLRREVRSSRGGDSLFGALHAAGLSTPEICSLGYFLVIAGQETTSQLINIAFYRALQEPRQWDRIADGHSARAHVRSVLATESSVHTWRRNVARETSLHGETLPAGAEILLELSGHHPADAGENAYSLAFGHGLHRCLGAKLAELESVLVLEATARTLPGIELSGPPPDWLRLLSFRTPLSVSVRSTRR